jgi:hypothetical protein
MLVIELGLVLLALFIAATFPRAGSRVFLKLEHRLALLAHRRRLAVAVVGIFALGLRLAVLAVEPIPDPVVHDEFSHLLLADTIAHGRLANPIHPMWIHFETFHVNQKPTYASMYYPGQGLFLAAGKVLFGHPFWGVWLSVGLMCAAICWALQGWLPPFWAFIGGLLAVIRIGTFSYWADSYWGGAVTALGGALVIGALPRIARHHRVRDAVLMGLGFALIGFTRPFEGLFFGLAVMATLVIWLRRNNRPPLPLVVRQIAFPFATVLAVALAAMGFYFWRVTGSPVRVPYQVNIATYHLVYFPWQKLRPSTEYHHAVLRSFYVGDEISGQYEMARSHPVQLLMFKAATLWLFFLGPVLSLPVLMLTAVLPAGISLRDIGRPIASLLFMCGCTAVALALPIHLPEPHYAAMLTTAIYALVLLAMQRVGRWRRDKGTGLFLVRAVPAICFALLLLRVAAPLAHGRIREPFPHTWCWPISPLVGRAPVVAQLDMYPGSHLVIVRYKPDHRLQLEWVYNEADIDHARIVWAHDMGLAANQELMRYFKDRQVWLLQPDETLQLLPYPVDTTKAGDLLSAADQNCGTSNAVGRNECPHR